MFSYLRGIVKEQHDQQLTLQVSGVGFSIIVARASLFPKETAVTVVVYLHWSQEQGPVLYGFVTEYEKAIFLMIIGCSGIGPRIALAVLEQLTPTAFLRAIQTADVKALSSISGIGPKKAEQMIVHLKHKVKDLLEKGSFDKEGDTVFLEQWKEVVLALQSLNYSRQEIDRAMGQVLQDNASKETSFDVMLRSALSFLSKRV